MAGWEELRAAAPLTGNRSPVNYVTRRQPDGDNLNDPGAIVKWDHATMAWLNLGFKSPWLH